MTAIIGWLLSNPAVITIVAGIFGALGWGIRQKRKGKAEERAKVEAERQKARNVADEVDNDIGAMPPDKARKELKKW